MSRPAIVERLRAAGCVFAEDEAELLVAAARTPDDLAALVARRVAGEPLEQVLGWAEFFGLRLTVRPGVFVPRRRTGFLVRTAAALAGPGAVVVDLCCGCGAIGAALAAALRGRVDLLVANVPYVPTAAIAAMPPEARDHEPHAALDGGADGLDVARRLVAGAPSWLAPGGHVLFETGSAQAAAAAAAVVHSGLTPRVASSGEDAATVVIGAMGVRPGTPGRRA